MKTRSVGIVGGGPAGIMAALEAARCGAHVTLFDTNAIVGRKLLVTGNGRCNISNQHATADRYTCAEPAFLEEAFSLCGHRETMARLHELGIPTSSTPDGWCYPLSNSAAAVAQTLGAMLNLAGVATRLKTKVADIGRAGTRYALTVGGGEQKVIVDRVVIACGGKAYPALGSKGALFPVLERLGHSIVPIRPALVPITAEVKQFHKLQGVRLDVGLVLFEAERVLGRSVGNMMFTQFGFSGPAPMNLSHLVSARPGKQLSLSIDLLPHHHGQLTDLIARWRSREVPLGVVLGAVMPPKAGPVITLLAGLPHDVRLADLSDADVSHLLNVLTHLVVRVTGTRGFRFAQVSTGGVPVTDVDPRTMESRILPGLYFAGEVLDVVGPCGGFNLQFAWTSGALAGTGTAT